MIPRPRPSHLPLTLLFASTLLLACKSAEQSTNTPQPAEPTQCADKTSPDCQGSAAESFEPIAYAEGEVSPAAKAIVDAEDRSAEDRETDARRHPAELLTFMSVQPGWRVADLAAGGGYTTELLVRSVGPEGTVFAHNTAMVIEKFVSETWPARLARAVNANVVRIDAEWSAPLPEAASDLDMVSLIFSYHDIIAFGGDVASVNAAVFAALKPGGFYVIADHSAVPRSATRDTEKLHRIDEAIVIEQVEAAGFKLDASADFLRAPEDLRDTEVWTVGFNTDRFVLRFVKPAN